MTYLTSIYPGSQYPTHYQFGSTQIVILVVCIPYISYVNYPTFSFNHMPFTPNFLHVPNEKRLMDAQDKQYLQQNMYFYISDDMDYMRNLYLMIFHMMTQGR